MFKRVYLLIFLLIPTIFLGGCTLPWQKESAPIIIPAATSTPVSNEVSITNTNSGQMKKFVDYSELQSFLEKQATVAPTYYRSAAREMANMDGSLANPMSMEGGSNVTKANFSNDDHSQTNVQVAGVDEADIIKTNGEYIYALVYKDLYIIKAYPADEAKAISKISFNSRPTDIYLDSGYLIVIGLDEQIMETSAYQNFRRQSPYTFVKIFDLVNPETPKQVRDLDFEGSYTDSRIVASNLYLIINNYNNYVSGENVVPRLVDGGKILTSDCSLNNRCFAPDVYYFDLPYNSYNFTSINVLDLKTPEEDVVAQTYILNEAQTVYVSAKNIFITYAQYLDENNLRLEVMRELFANKLSVSEHERFLKIDQADSDILSLAEKNQKLLQIFQNFLATRSSSELLILDSELESALKQKYEAESKNLERTVIHKLALNGGNPIYRATGSVSGIVLNQFSLDEDAGGNLRIATTRSRDFSSLVGEQASYSNLYVLSPSLQVLGELENLAPGERIYSVRFMDSRAYLVTFKQIDPLLVLDLSNAQAPKLLGELKIPGFSNYLHPYDDNTLIGLGKDTSLDSYGNVKTGGIKLSLFDVRNPAQPLELDNYVIGAAGSDSLALLNHKAFLFSLAKNLLLIPAALTATSDNFRPYFSGALVFSINDGKFSLRAQIDHSDGGKYQRSDYWCGYNCYDNSVQRGLYIKDILYTFSNKYLKLNSLSDLSSLKSIKLLPDTEIDLELPPLTNEEPEPTEFIDEPVLLGPTLPAIAPDNGNDFVSSEIVIPETEEITTPSPETLDSENNDEGLPLDDLDM